ncbi:hypothetical protein ACQCVP_04900 [Rossellomorea vietnamensis]
MPVLKHIQTFSITWLGEDFIIKFINLCKMRGLPLLKLKPDFYTNHLTNVDAEWLHHQKIKLVLVDLDQTLVNASSQAKDKANEWIRN